MTSDERRATVWLAWLYGTRMLGLFLVLPVFAVHAAGMPGGDDAALVGFALGIYGLAQALLQIPFGLLSDRFGRKPVITVGLALMVVGAVVAALAETLTGLAIGRTLQGAGAVSAAISALVADSTRDSQRSKAMAMIGATIGVSYALSLVASPLLYRLSGLSGLFMLTAVMSAAAIVILWTRVPSRPATAMPTLAAAADAVGAAAGRADAEPAAASGTTAGTQADPVSGGYAAGAAALWRRAFDGDLLRLNLGIFVLHLTQMALFVVVPHRLVATAGLPLAQHWMLYLPVVVLSFAAMLVPLAWAERAGHVRMVFLVSIVAQAVVQLGFAALPFTLVTAAVLLAVFFVSFNLLEALLPSLVSRLAPVESRGFALGVYSTTQALGVFCGGAAGGLMAARLGDTAVFVAAAALIAAWAVVASGARRWPRRPVASAAEAGYT